MKYSYIVLAFSFFFGCKDKEISEKKPTLSFVDEFIVKDSLIIKNSVIGGLSGIDFFDDSYYIVVDDSRDPRFVKAKIDINKDTITAINFTDVVFLKDSMSPFYQENALDLESIFVDVNTNQINLVSEGRIFKGKNPTVFSVDTLGNLAINYQVPNMFYANSKSKPVNNAVFEGSCKSIDGKGFWVAMEAPLESDGAEATFKKTNSPIRITYFDAETQKATKQFSYQLENITKPAKGKFNVNGLTAILEYQKNHFFIIERTYQSGYGSYGNIVRIFSAKINENTTNVLTIKSLKEERFISLEKELVLNFATIQGKLTDGIIDNIEGITFGPKLESGNQSIIVISDNNFNKYDAQLNQFILLELSEE